MTLKRTVALLLAAPLAAAAQIQVVGDEACPKYAIDIAAFATCDGDRVARPLQAGALQVAAVMLADVPPLKRSASGMHVTAAEAVRIRRDYPGQVALIDIRPRLEAHYAGQPVNVDIHVPFREPILDATAHRLNLQRNPNFVAEVKAALTQQEWPEDTMLLLICRSGELSAIAADALAAAGLEHVFTIVDGFEGDIGASGRRDVNGWKNAGGHWRAVPLARLNPSPSL